MNSEQGKLNLDLYLGGGSLQLDVFFGLQKDEPKTGGWGGLISGS